MSTVTLHDRIEQDLHEARFLGCNVTHRWADEYLKDARVEPGEIARRRRRVEVYARRLLRAAHADVGRLARARELATARAQPDENGRRRRGYANAVVVIDVAMDLLRQAGADTDEDARARFLKELEAGWALPGESSPGHQRLWHRHRLPRRALRRFDPRRWRDRAWAWSEVRMVHEPSDDGPAGYQQILMQTAGREIGRLDYQICDRCQLGFIAKISIDLEHQGKGLGTRAVELIRVQAPGYRWSTSGQYDTAKTFWQRMSRRTGDAYRGNDDGGLGACQHMSDG